MSELRHCLLTVSHEKEPLVLQSTLGKHFTRVGLSRELHMYSNDSFDFFFLLLLLFELLVLHILCETVKVNSRFDDFNRNIDTQTTGWAFRCCDVTDCSYIHTSRFAEQGVFVQEILLRVAPPHSFT